MLQQISSTFVIATALGMGPLLAAASDLPHAKTMELVRLMKLDRAMVVAARGELIQSMTIASARRRFVSCLNSARLDPITELLAIQIENELSPAQIHEAVEFYQSSPGRKYTERDLSVLDAEAMHVSTPQIKMSNAELMAIERFVKSSTGDRLFVKGLTYSDKLMRELNVLVTEVLIGCRPADVR